MRKVFNILSSSKLGISLFLLIAAASILGTLIPQGASSGFYISKYGETWGKLILKLNLDDAYHSWWYICLLVIFMINLITCSIKWFPKSWKLFKRNPCDLSIEKLPNKVEEKLNLESNKLSNLEDFIKDLGFVLCKKQNQEVLFCKDKNRFSYLLVYVVHFAVILVIVGGLIGAVWGFRGSMAILEGETSNMVMPFKKRSPIFLNFYIKLKKFLIERYKDGTPKAYISKVEVIDGKKKFDTVIKVNSPLRYKGISFYQANYQEVPEFEIEVFFKDKRGLYTINWLTPLIINNRFSLTLKQVGRMKGLLYATVTLIDTKTGKEYDGVIIQGFPHFVVPVENGVLRIMLLGVKDIKYISVFEVTKDPGVWLVFAGFIVIILGLMGIYFFEPKTIWIGLKEKKIVGGAIAKRSKDNIKEELLVIMERIKNLR